MARKAGSDAGGTLTKDGSRPVSFRLSLLDYVAYKEKFAAAGLTQSEFFREHVLNNTTKVIAKPVESRDFKRAVFLLQKASNNLNQLAHRANSENVSGALSETTFLAITHQLEQLNKFMLDQVRAFQQ